MPNRLLKTLKPFLRWVILGAVVVFLIKTIGDRAADVAELSFTGTTWIWLGGALIVTSLAHLWSGWVWRWILREFGQPAPLIPVMQVYLKTNIAKYLPGNVWHFYGRIRAAHQWGMSWAGAAATVVLEPLLMAAAALILGTVAAPQGNWWIQGAIAAAVLIGVHPKFLNPLLKKLGRSKLKSSTPTETEEAPVPAQLTTAGMKRYPALPFLGEGGFLLLRGAGFLCVVAAFDSNALIHWPQLLSGFGLAWLVGLVVPGAPGGVGVFEATALGLLGKLVAPGALLAGVACYRLVSVIAEAGLATIAYIPLGDRSTV
ncbi:MAG: YbhN family protein [Cyanobacteria bacterium P01_C01_bin.89]